MEVEVKVSLGFGQAKSYTTRRVRNILVARAACIRLAATCGDSSETVGEVVRDNPWGLVGAHVSITAITGGCGVVVCQGRVVLVTDGDWARDISLVGP